MSVGHSFCVLVMVSTALGQRPGFAGSRPIGFPELYDRTTEANDLGNRFGEANSTNSVNLPIEANGDKRLVEYLLTLPEDKQPFWLLNWQALEEQRKNPQTFDLRPNVFIQPVRLDSVLTTARPKGKPSPNQGVGVASGGIPVAPATASSNPITNTVTKKPDNIAPTVKPSNGDSRPNVGDPNNYAFTTGPKVTFTGTSPPRFGGENIDKNPDEKNPNSNTASFNSTFHTSSVQANGPLSAQTANGVPLNGNFQSNFQTSSLQNSGVMSNTTSGTHVIAPGVTAHTTNYSTSWFNSYAFANSYNYSTHYGSDGQPITNVVSSNGQQIPGPSSSNGKQTSLQSFTENPVSHSNGKPIASFPQFGSDGQPIKTEGYSNGQPIAGPVSNGQPVPLAIPSHKPVVITHKVVLEPESGPKARPIENGNAAFAAVSSGLKKRAQGSPGYSTSANNGYRTNTGLQIPIVQQLRDRHQQRRQERDSYEDSNRDYEYVITI